MTSSSVLKEVLDRVVDDADLTTIRVSGIDLETISCRHRYVDR